MKNFVRRAWILGLATAMAVPAIAAAQNAGKAVVAVFYFDNNSIGKDAKDYDGIGKGVADMLITDLAANPKVTVVDRDRIQSLLQEQGMVKAGQIDAATAVRLGKIVGAQYAIVGGFMSDGRGNVVLTAHSINMETSAITNPQRVQAKSDDVLGLIAQLSAKVGKDMNLPPMPARRVGETGGASSGSSVGAASTAKTTEVAATPAAKSERKMDLKTAMLYSKALEETDNGNKAKAVELYNQVLVKFPDYTPAQQNLQKLSKSGD